MLSTSLRNHLCRLCDLLKEDVPFMLESHHQASTDKIKPAISEESTLRYVDTAKLPTLQTDASIMGLGASLIQDGQPIAHASKALSDAETRYTCTEREFLAVVFSIQRFHTYLYGRPFKVITDHKPLVMILNKPLTSAPPLKLKGYNFTIEHPPGSTMVLADTLSRLPSPRNQREIDLNIQEHKPSQQRETLRPHEIPQCPWEVLGPDLFYFQGAKYLLVADYYSMYFVVHKLGQNISSRQ